LFGVVQPFRKGRKAKQRGTKNNFILKGTKKSKKNARSAYFRKTTPARPSITAGTVQNQKKREAIARRKLGTRKSESASDDFISQKGEAALDEGS